MVILYWRAKTKQMRTEKQQKPQIKLELNYAIEKRTKDQR